MRSRPDRQPVELHGENAGAGPGGDHGFEAGGSDVLRLQRDAGAVALVGIQSRHAQMHDRDRGECRVKHHRHRESARFARVVPGGIEIPARREDPNAKVGGKDVPRNG